jgi:hypothetical protein
MWEPEAALAASTRICNKTTNFSSCPTEAEIALFCVVNYIPKARELPESFCSPHDVF